MANFSKLVITDVGKQLLNLKLNSQQELLFTEMVMSESKYDMAALEGLTDLDGIRQRVGIRKMSRTGNVIQIDSVFLNSDLEEGYFANTLGIYARLGEDTLVLFAVAVEQTRAAYMPQRSKTLSGMEIKLKITLENADNITIQMDQSAMATVGDVLELESNIEQHVNDLNNPHQTNKTQVGLDKVDNTSDKDKPVSEAQQAAIDGAYQQATGYTDQQIAYLINGAPGDLDTLGEIAEAMRNNSDVMSALNQAIGSKASQAEVDGHTGNSTIHITASERQAWNDKQTKTGDAKDNIVSFESGDSDNPTGWINVALFTAKEKLSSLFKKVSQMNSNLKYLFKLTGPTSLTGIGDGTVTGAISALNTGLNEKAPSNHTHNYIPTSATCNKNWQWSGQAGQPSWLWGCNDGSNCYVWNPANFSVNYAASAGSANSVAWANITGKPGMGQWSDSKDNVSLAQGGNLVMSACVSISGWFFVSAVSRILNNLPVTNTVTTYLSVSNAPQYLEWWGNSNSTSGAVTCHMLQAVAIFHLNAGQYINLGIYANVACTMNRTILTWTLLAPD